jgi:hypothetical protein
MSTPLEDYGRTIPGVNRLPDGTLRAIAGPDLVVLHTDVPLQVRPDDRRRIRCDRRGHHTVRADTWSVPSAAT